MKKPSYSLLLVIFWGVGAAETVFQGFLNSVGVTLFAAAFPLILLSLLFFIKMRIRTPSPITKRVVFFGLCYLFYSQLSSLWSTDPAFEFFQLSKLFFIIIALGMSVEFISTKCADQSLLLLFLSGTFFAFIATPYIVNLADFELISRAFGGGWAAVNPYTDKNVGFMLLLLGFIFFAASLGKSRDVNTSFIIVLLSGLSFIVFVGLLSGSRRALILAVAVLAIATPFYFKSARGARVAFLLPVLVGVAILLSYIFPVLTGYARTFQMHESSLGRGLSVLIDTPGSYRLEAWSHAWEKFSNGSIWAMLFGNGRGDTATDLYAYPHNFILSELLQGGMISLTLLSCFFAAIFHWLVKTAKYRSDRWNFSITASIAIVVIGRLISFPQFFSPSTRDVMLIFLVVVLSTHTSPSRAYLAGTKSRSSRPSRSWGGRCASGVSVVGQERRGCHQ